LAGGLGTRLYPLTYATNKHLLPVYDRPMVFYPIQTLVRAGVTEILIVTGGPHAGHFINVLRNGKELGISHLEFAFQEKNGGISDALSLAENFASSGPVTVILGDNTTDAEIKKPVKSFKDGAVIFIKEVPDPQRYGVIVFSPDEPQKIIRVEEKPRIPKSSFISTGLYIFDNKCFDFIRKCKPSKRGELEITDVQNQYIKTGSLKWKLLEGFWTDAGKSESLFLANSYWANKKNRQSYSGK